jgi:hypothetical protein
MQPRKWAGDIEDLRAERARLNTIRNERQWLMEQIYLSKRTIEDSRELLRQLDELLAKVGDKP